MLALILLNRPSVSVRSTQEQMISWLHLKNFIRYFTYRTNGKLHPALTIGADRNRSLTYLRDGKL